MEVVLRLPSLPASPSLPALLIALSLSAAVAGCSSSGQHCVPDAGGGFTKCVGLDDGGSPDCTSTQACVAIDNDPKDTRCEDVCSGNNCPAGFACTPTAVGPCTHDAGPCTTLFLCHPIGC